MYEDQTYETILDRAKENMSDDIQKDEGGLVFMPASVLALEAERLYVQADYLITQMNPDTADLEHLKIIAAARGIYPDEATYALVKITTNVAVPIGTRFSLAGYNYAVEKDLESNTYAARCETAGTAPNNLTGELVAIDYVDGLETATLDEILTPGENADGVTELLAKYKASFNNKGYAGNITAYKQKMLEFDGIGGSKIYPVWNGGGTVKVVLISSDFGVVSDYLVKQIREAVDPVPAEGYGFAPIGHTVTVESAEGVDINVKATVTYEGENTFSTLSDAIKAAIEAYLLEERKAWPGGDCNTSPHVYISRITSAILSVSGVLDVQNVTVNGQTGNTVLEPNQIPILGTVEEA